MNATPPAGRIWVGGGFALALVFILGALWWTTRPKLITTSDAIWVLPVAGASDAAAEDPADSNPSGDLGEIEELVEAESIVPDLPKSPAVLAAEESLAFAEAELQDYLDKMQLSRDAIEEAVVMVQEQRENFDYAFERFETLMPLVETGALEPLAASQIQSAYISARASLAQAKFFLGQARREFGTEESRRRTHNRLQRQIAEAREELEVANGMQGSSLTDREEEANGNIAGQPGPAGAYGFVEGVFVVSRAEIEFLQVGANAIIYSPGASEQDMPVSARVQEVFEATPIPGKNSLVLRVRLTPAAMPAWETFHRTTLPCRVVILPAGNAP